MQINDLTISCANSPLKGIAAQIPYVMRQAINTSKLCFP